jgi:hypothetical protein
MSATLRIIPQDQPAEDQPLVWMLALDSAVRRRVKRDTTRATAITEVLGWLDTGFFNLGDARLSVKAA